ncbi:hypothetical protein [Sulfitobacter guttiformis]|uniref:Uncharacterized protein n=1 Tax=Sulfitobacter guttiformis TaxID=74349 RepID=A0A420DHD0_9RHOB|nr:hypothetical protein [Sulfitobacter guttiformis]RKE93620.1 hypothetical protein C8N30_2697 [Sulfitobacter guttiformis]
MSDRNYKSISTTLSIEADDFLMREVSRTDDFRANAIRNAIRFWLRKNCPYAPRAEIKGRMPAATPISLQLFVAVTEAARVRRTMKTNIVRMAIHTWMDATPDERMALRNEFTPIRNGKASRLGETYVMGCAYPKADADFVMAEAKRLNVGNSDVLREAVGSWIRATANNKAA